MSTPARTSLAERTPAVEVHFILLHFRLEDVTTGSVPSGKELVSSGVAANCEIVTKRKGQK